MVEYTPTGAHSVYRENLLSSKQIPAQLHRSLFYPSDEGKGPGGEDESWKMVTVPS
jgi:hypothetical protein